MPNPVESSSGPLITTALQGEALEVSNGILPLNSAASRISSASSTSLTSIRGIPTCKSGPVDFTGLGSGAEEHVKKLLTVARLDPFGPDRGSELSALIVKLRTDPTLQGDPDKIVGLLGKLHAVAASNTLFGKSEAEYQSEGIDFKKLRREFLVEVIRGAVASDNITQGKEPLCTIASACKMLPPAEFLRLATDFALHGEATTKSGAQLTMRPGFLERAKEASEAALGDVKCARRSPGFLMMLYAVADLGDSARAGEPLVLRQEGMYWHQYALMVENLLGEKVSCAHRSANNILIDQNNARFTASSIEGAQAVDLFGYVEAQLQHGRSVFIDTKFNFSSRNSTSGSEHCRHALIAEKFETINGERWVRCSNPIGDFVDTSKSARNHAEFFRQGTELGDRNGFWFVTAENGDILVRQDVLKRNIQTALIQHGEEYRFKLGDKPQFIGDAKFEEAGAIIFFDLEEEKEQDTPKSVAELIGDRVQSLAEKLELFTKKERQGSTEATPGHYTAKDEGVKTPPLSERLLEEALEVAEAEARVDAAKAKERQQEREESEGKNPFFGRMLR